MVSHSSWFRVHLVLLPSEEASSGNKHPCFSFSGLTEAAGAASPQNSRCCTARDSGDFTAPWVFHSHDVGTWALHHAILGERHVVGGGRHWRADLHFHSVVLAATVRTDYGIPGQKHRDQIGDLSCKRQWWLRWGTDSLVLDIFWRKSQQYLGWERGRSHRWLQGLWPEQPEEWHCHDQGEDTEEKLVWDVPSVRCLQVFRGALSRGVELTGHLAHTGHASRHFFSIGNFNPHSNRRK